MKTESELLCEMIEAFLEASFAKKKFVEADKELTGRVNLVFWVQGKL